MAFGLSPAFQGRGTERSESDQRAGKGRKRLRSEVEWSGPETPESGGFPRRQSATFRRIENPGLPVRRSRSLPALTVDRLFAAAKIALATIFVFMLL